MTKRGETIHRLEVDAYRVPADQHESDGTLAWDTTPCVVVRAHNNGTCGLGYTYGPAATAELIDEKLGGVVCGLDAMSPARAWGRMLEAVRNMGRQGVAAHAISAIDVALWDLKARLLGVPLSDLWGRVRERAPVYGSGGFTSYDEEQLREQLIGWVEGGIRRVKIKVGRRPDLDVKRVRLARDAIGPDVELFVDANGAYDRKQALWFAEAFAEHGVTWYEEPVSADDLQGLRLLRDRGPAGMAISAGEYGYHPYDFRRLLEVGAVDTLQADVTRCLGYTGFLKAAALCEAWNIPLSTHTAPALHAALGASVGPVVHVEHFHDHVRI
ncbi:MAG: enolase C-terminal domain-like protein, partial [Myxococcota bacterium]